MILLVLAIIAFLLMAGLISAGLVLFRFVRTWNNIKSDLADFFTVQDKDGFTQFSHFITDYSEAAAVRIGQNVQAGINGSIGGMVKGMNAELQEAAGEISPAHAVMAALPRSTKKNKWLMPVLEYVIGKQFGAPGQGSGGNGEFKLPEQGGLKL